MYTCPICGKESNDKICKSCGFDISCNYEHYPTLTFIDNLIPSVSRRRDNYKTKFKNYIYCKICGGRTFYADPETENLICSFCFTPVNKPENTKKSDNPFENFTLTEALEYADNLIDDMDYEKKESIDDVCKKLKLLYERFPENEDIASYYCHSVSILSMFLNYKELNEAVSELSLIFSKFSDNEFIADSYGTAVLFQTVSHAFLENYENADILKNLHEKFENNNNLAELYASILPIINLYQNEGESEKTLSEFKALTKKFKDNENIAYQYANALAIMALYDNGEEYDNIVAELNYILDRFPNNNDISILYAAILSKICQDLSYESLRSFVKNLENMKAVFDDNDEIYAAKYAKALHNLSHYQEKSEKDITISKLKKLVKKFPGNGFIKTLI